MKVLIAIDPSEHTENALSWYMDHHRADNEVLLVHISELPLNQSVNFATAMAIPKHQWDALFQDSKDLFKALRTKLSRQLVDRGISHKCVRAEGHPGPTLCELAKSEKADMIVLGTRGMGKLRRTFLGSVSDYVLHHAHVPVVICRK